MEGILGPLIPIVSVLTFGGIFISRGPIGQALARRLAGPGGESSEEVLELREQLDLLRNEVTDVQERLDFAERLLARTREAESLPDPR
jgi:hypothetical protein